METNYERRMAIVSNNADSNHIERFEYCTILERALQKDTNMI